MKFAYIEKKFNSGTLDIIKKANGIIEEYSDEGYDLTLRQLYYQFVARGLLENIERNYKRLGSIVSDARLAGHVDWNSIVDRLRSVQQNSHWDNPAEIIHSAASSYAIDKRQDQSVYIETWVEKEALAGVVERACEPLDVPFFSCKGYVSQSAMWRAARRIVRELTLECRKGAVILHLGDHDPSGIDMTRDIQERLELFGGNCIEVRRIALNLDQIEQYGPPPNPAKVTDSRYNSYVDEYGDESWELDALDPRVLVDLVRGEVAKRTDSSKYKALERREAEERAKLQEIADNFEDY